MKTINTKLYHCFLLLLCLLPGTPVLAQSSVATALLKGNAENGKILYQQFSCYACHGHTGETGSGTRLNPPRFDQAGFIAYIRSPSGRMIGTGPSAMMPAYASEVVTDKKLADIYSYIASIPSGSPPLESIPLLYDMRNSD